VPDTTYRRLLDEVNHRQPNVVVPVKSADIFGRTDIKG
jgi:hypothetical protein